MAATIPVIGLTPVLAAADGSSVSTTACELVAAAASHGFVFVRAAVPGAASILRAFELSNVLFDAPDGDKATCAIGTDNRGWSGPRTEALDPASQQLGDNKETFNFGPLDSLPGQPLPCAFEPHRAEIEAFQQSCHSLCVRILTLLGIGLGLDPPDFLTLAHLPSAGPSSTILRFLRYPPLTEGADVLAEKVRAGAHSDYGSITLLFRLRGDIGLEIQTREGGWAAVPVDPPGTAADDWPPILVNVGDLLEHWTDGRLRSTIHRVVFSPDDTTARRLPRRSIAYFCHPADQTPLDPVPLARSGRQAQVTDPVRRALTAREHLTSKLAASHPTIYKRGE